MGNILQFAGHFLACQAPPNYTAHTEQEKFVDRLMEVTAFNPKYPCASRETHLRSRRRLNLSLFHPGQRQPARLLCSGQQHGRLDDPARFGEQVRWPHTG